MLLAKYPGDQAKENELVTWGGGLRGAYRVFVGKPEGKWALGTPRLIWEDNIKMNF